MFKFAGAIVDFYDDPDFLENPDDQNLFGGVIFRPEDIKSQPDRYFSVLVKTAAGTHRKFPIHSKAAAAISGGYFNKIASALPDEIRKTAGFFLKQAHLMFGLNLPVALRESFPAPEAGRLVEWAPTPEPEPASRESLVKVAEYAFMDRHRSMHCLEKVEKAFEIAKIAESVGMPIEEREVWDYVPKEKWGPFVREGLTQREVHINDPMIKEAFLTIMGHIRDGNPAKAPFLLYEFDKMAGFQNRYGLNGFYDPFYTFWGGFLMRKEASVEKDLVEYKLGTIARNNSILKSIFPENFISKFVRNPKGTYEDATPEQRKLLDFMMTKIPAEMKEEEADSGVTPKTKGAPLVEAAKKVTEPLKKEQTTPSQRPASLGGGEWSLIHNLEKGL